MEPKALRNTGLAVILAVCLALITACARAEEQTATVTAKALQPTVIRTLQAVDTLTPAPTETPRPTDIQMPSDTPAPTDIPAPTQTLPPPEPTVTFTPLPVQIPEGIRSAGFARLYQPVPALVPDTLDVDGDYDLPVDLGALPNSAQFTFNAAQEGLLRQNGFLVTPADWLEFFQLYEHARYQELPVFVTTDSLLHVYHLLFDKMLRDLERERLAPAIESLTDALEDAARVQYEEAAGTPLEDPARRVWGYFVVAQQLIAAAPPAVPDAVADEVGRELVLIEAHAGVDMSPLLSLPEAFEEGLFCDPNATPEQARKFYCEDYSQYVPRGHYTRDEQLQRYFRTMMWYGRITAAQILREIFSSSALGRQTQISGSLPMYGLVSMTPPSFSWASQTT
jgi:hypothetical protein